MCATGHARIFQQFPPLIRYRAKAAPDRRGSGRIAVALCSTSLASLRPRRPHPPSHARRLASAVAWRSDNYLAPIPLETNKRIIETIAVEDADASMESDKIHIKNRIAAGAGVALSEEQVGHRPSKRRHL